MSARSLLFVPGDGAGSSPGDSVPADILILDVEDSGFTRGEVRARSRIREFLAARSAPRVRAVGPHQSDSGPRRARGSHRGRGVRPDSIVQPKVRSADDVLKPRPVSMRSRRKAASNRSASGSCRSPWRHPKRSSRWAAAGRCGLRLYGLTWGAEDLSAAIGATGNKRPDGSWTQPFQLARSLCLFAAGAAGVAAIDTLHSDIRDEQGLRASCAEARRDGFTGKLAIHPDQVAVINECFLPSADEIAHATRVIALFRDNPGVATLALDGQMLDIPHLRQAEQTLARASVQRG